jgi:IS30 family transposase
LSHLNGGGCFFKKEFWNPTKSKEANEIASKLKRILMSECGDYSFIQSDQGSEFVNGAVKELLSTFNVSLLKSRPYHPQSQGIMERLNSTIKKTILRKISQEGKEQWREMLMDVIHKYNNTPHRSLNFQTPAEVHNPLTRKQKEKEEDDFINKILFGAKTEICTR